MARDSTSPFLSNYLCFDPSSVGGSDLKSLTILGASVVSLLAYKSTDATQVAQEFRSERFTLVRDHGIVSSVWNYNDSSNAEASGKRALLAWSTRLQTVFLGFPGTQSKADILKDSDVRFKASPDLASRFHQGFHNEGMSYRGLVQELSKKYRVVICGHSLGGAVAAILTYEVLATGHRPRSSLNAWDGPQGLSAISFGSPPAMVPELEGTTAAFIKSVGRNIHTVINASDSIPFSLVNTSVEAISSVAQYCLAFIQPSLPSLATDLASRAGRGVIGYLRGGDGRFVHFGCIYVLDTLWDDSMHCRSVNSPGFLPPTPEHSKQSVTSNHSMSHYHNCVSRIMKDPNTWVGLVIGPVPSSLMDPEEFILHSFGPPSSIFNDFEGHIHDDKIVIAGAIRSTRARYLISHASFKLKAQTQRMTSLCFSYGADANQVLVNMEYHIDHANDAGFILEAADAIQKNLRIHDVFGRDIRVAIVNMQHTSAVDISLPPTFESIRHSMLIALVEQTSSVQRLRAVASSSSEEKSSLAAVLTAKASRIAKLIDRFVADANPHLFVSNLQNGCKHLNGMWEATIQDVKSNEKYYSRMADEYNFQSPESETPGMFPPGDERIPSNCPGGLKLRLSEILRQLDVCCKRDYSRNAWSKQPHATLGTTGAVTGSSFSKCLSDYTRDLCMKHPSEEKRIGEAIKHMDDLLDEMRFCHLVILTQLDADPDWFFEMSDVEGRGVFTSASLAAALAGLAYSPNVAGLYAAGSSIALGSIAIFARHYLQRPKQRQGLQYEDKLAISLEILGIPRQKFGINMENSISELLEASHSRNSDRMSTKDRLEKLVQYRMRQYRGLPTSFVNGKNRIQPTSLWISWLLMVAEIGELRTTITANLRVGVIGPTEAGKSELLSTLTGVPENVFRPGSSLAGRTMEVQAYEPPKCRGVVFLDFPGCDDQDPQMREIGRLFRAILDVVIFVGTHDALRSEARKGFLEEIAEFLSNDEERRPVRVLLSRADLLPFNRNRRNEFTRAVRVCREETIKNIKEFGKLGQDFSVRCRQTIQSKRTSNWGSGVVLGTEALEDIVWPYSSWAQQRYDDVKALSDCKPFEDAKITEKSKFEHLYELAEAGELLWDVESLRRWLLDIMPGSLPRTTRVSSENVSWQH